MAGVLKLYPRSFSKSFNIHVLRYCSGFNQETKALSISTCEKVCNAFAKHKSETLITKHEIFFRKITLHQQRCIQISAFLYEDKVVKTPEFPESISEGDIKWEKKVGDNVQVDDIVCEIETDKTAIPVPAPVQGVIAELFFKDGDTVKAGSQLFRMTVGAGAVAAPTPPAAEPRKPAPPTPAPSVKPPPSKAPPTPKAAPPVQGALVRMPPASPTTEISGTRTEYRLKMNRMRQKIASRLKEAQNTCAMLTTFNEIDMSSLIAFRKENQDAFTKKHGIKLGFMSPFIKAVTYALEDQPVVNAVIEGNEVVYRDYIDLSIAVATPKGLLVPVIRNANYLNFGEIEKSLADLGKKARDGKLSVEDMEGGTFSISNGGVFGSLLSTPIINIPQSAILGMHATFDRPVAIKGQVVIRPMMYVTLTYDHRLIDGREAVLFLRKIKAAVEDPRIIIAGL